MVCRSGLRIAVSSILLLTLHVASIAYAQEERQSHPVYHNDQKMLEDLHNKDLEIQELKKELQALKHKSDEQQVLTKAGK